MNVDRMRLIDRRVGVPLCFLTSLLLRLTGSGGAPTPLPRRILFIELSEMGSTILADPAMQKAQRLWGAELFFVIFTENRGSLDFLRTVPEANIFTLRVDSLWHLGLDTLRLLRWTRRRGIDTVVDLELFSRFTALLTGLAGAERRVGFHRFHNEGLYRGEMLTHRVAYNPHQHIAKNFIALINALAAPTAEVPFSKTVISDDEIRIDQVVPAPTETQAMAAAIDGLIGATGGQGRRLVLLNPNASEILPQRRWPAEHFAQLATLMLARWPDLHLLITGAPAEWAEAERLRLRVDDPRIANFAGASRLEQLPALYHLATLMITNDSGPGHFASVTPLPTISLFGPETPALYGPGLLALRLGRQPPQDRLFRPGLYARDQPGTGAGGGGAGARSGLSPRHRRLAEPGRFALE
jgi:ADP-heptose:LPS heptosyltransferase